MAEATREAVGAEVQEVVAEEVAVLQVAAEEGEGVCQLVLTLPILDSRRC